jgi:hypothetical protein
LSEDELLQERLDNLREAVREIRDELNAYKRRAFQAVVALAAYLGWAALHNLPAFEVLFK